MTGPHDLRRDNRWYGYRRDGRDARDHLFVPSRRKALLDVIDLEDNCCPILNQSTLGSCVTHGGTEALRFDLIASGKPDVALSRLQAYYDGRVVEGTVASDSGLEIRDFIKCAAKIGVGRESLWPYKISKFTQKPPAAVYKSAVDFNAISYQRVTVAADHIRAALATKRPVIFGVALYESFESLAVEKNGIVPMPDLKREKMVGGHCMLAVGYRKGVFKVQNSWDTDWGDRGFCYFPAAYIGSPKFGGDYWRIQSVG